MPGRPAKTEPTGRHEVPSTAIRSGRIVIKQDIQDIQEVDPKTIKSKRHRKTPKRSLWSKVE